MALMNGVLKLSRNTGSDLGFKLRSLEGLLSILEVENYDLRIAVEGHRLRGNLHDWLDSVEPMFEQVKEFDKNC